MPNAPAPPVPSAARGTPGPVGPEAQCFHSIPNEGSRAPAVSSGSALAFSRRRWGRFPISVEAVETLQKLLFHECGVSQRQSVAPRQAEPAATPWNRDVKSGKLDAPASVRYGPPGRESGGLFAAGSLLMFRRITHTSPCLTNATLIRYPSIATTVPSIRVLV